MDYLLHLVIYLGIYLIVALSLNLVVGYCGLLTLAHAGYYAVGAYTYAIISLKLGWDFIPAACAGALIAAALSLAVSLPSWRLRGDFFVLASLAVQTLIASILYNWSSTSAPFGTWANLTNGPLGITGIPSPTFFGVSAASPLPMAIFTTATSAVCALILWRLKMSPWGRLLLVMRDDELAARGLGKNTRLAKVQAFALSGAIVAVAGSLYAAHVHYLDPSSASLDDSILMLSMVIVGGMGNFRGPVVGACMLVLLPEILRFLELPNSQAANLRLLIYGVLLVLFMHIRPQGIAGNYRMK
jgi:branched-chain amino acid transport system permease protein